MNHLLQTQCMKHIHFWYLFSIMGIMFITMIESNIETEQQEINVHDILVVSKC